MSAPAVVRRSKKTRPSGPISSRQAASSSSTASSAGSSPSDPYDSEVGVTLDASRLWILPR